MEISEATYQRLKAGLLQALDASRRAVKFCEVMQMALGEITVDGYMDVKLRDHYEALIHNFDRRHPEIVAQIKVEEEKT